MSVPYRYLLPAILCLCSPLSAQYLYGSATPDYAGVAPRFDLRSPRLGDASFSLELRDAPGQATAVLVVGLLPTDFAFGATRVLVDPSALLIIAPVACGGVLGNSGSGSASFPLPLVGLPPALAGLVVYAQWFAEDPIVGGTFTATHGNRLELALPPLVFAGSSVAGSVDPFAFVDPLAGTVAATGGTGGYGDNVRGAVFVDGGAKMFVSAAIQSKINVADLTGPSPVWSPLYTSPLGYTYGLAYDRVWKRLYTLAGNVAAARELVAVDGDPLSPTYGQSLGQTTSLAGGGGKEKWALSPDGRIAAVPRIYASVGDVVFVDVDPASPTYLQTIFVTNPPVNGWPGYPIASDSGFTPDGRIFHMLISGLGTSVVLRFDVVLQSWIDHDPLTPAIDPISYPAGMASRFALAPDGRSALVTASAGGGSAYLLSFDAPTAPYFTFTPVLPGSGLLASATAPSFSPDGALAAFAGQAPSKIVVFDTASGALVSSVPISFSSVWTAFR